MKTTILILGLFLTHFQPALQGQDSYSAKIDLSKKIRDIDFTTGSKTDSFKVGINKNTAVFPDLDQVRVRKIIKGYDIVSNSGKISDTVRLRNIRARSKNPNPNNLIITSAKYNNLMICKGNGDLIAEGSSVQKGRRLNLTIDIAGKEYRKELISVAIIHLITQSKIRSNPQLFFY